MWIHQENLSALLPKYLLKTDDFLPLPLLPSWFRPLSPLTWDAATAPHGALWDTSLLSPLVYSPLSSQRGSSDTTWDHFICLLKIVWQAPTTGPLHMLPSARNSLPLEICNACCSFPPFLGHLLGEHPLNWPLQNSPLSIFLAPRDLLSPWTSCIFLRIEKYLHVWNTYYYILSYKLHEDWNCLSQVNPKHLEQSLAKSQYLLHEWMNKRMNESINEWLSGYDFLSLQPRKIYHLLDPSSLIEFSVMMETFYIWVAQPSISQPHAGMEHSKYSRWSGPVFIFASQTLFSGTMLGLQKS